ncbi:MAG: AmmeMemoRadiSam system radical SAM enzyme [Planctomycetes bacterium]|nr:AmmeMemoRadiSam system radical SAM enzyme [Planctomycetota bacterium]
MHEAMYWKPANAGRVECTLCPHRCIIPEGGRGICRGRVNSGGKLLAESFGRITSMGMDPIEKKPLYHFQPGSRIMSVGTYGCNLRCSFCQNHDISQKGPPEVAYREVSPQDLVLAAAANGSAGIAYTYNEPMIWYEYVLETAVLAHRAGLANVLVTNGYVNPEPFAELAPHTDAMNVDIKSFRDEFYKDLAGASLQPVLDTVKAGVKAGIHVETTTLIIPGHNDGDRELDALAAWIAAEAGPETPAHLSAYFPRYRLKAPATPLETLMRAQRLFRKHLEYVYLGNVPADSGSDSRCAECGRLLVERSGYQVNAAGLAADGTCAGCGAKNHFVRGVKRKADTSDK